MQLAQAIWTALDEAVLEAISLGVEVIDSDVVRCLMGLNRSGQFRPKYLAEVGVKLIKIVRTSTNPKILKGAVIGLIFFIEKLTRDIDKMEGSKRKPYFAQLAAQAKEINTAFRDLLGKKRKKMEVDEILGTLLSVGINFTDDDYQPSLFSITVYKLVKNAYDYISESGQTSMEVTQDGELDLDHGTGG